MTVSDFLLWWMRVGPSHVVIRSWHDRDNRFYYFKHIVSKIWDWNYTNHKHIKSRWNAISWVGFINKPHSPIMRGVKFNPLVKTFLKRPSLGRVKVLFLTDEKQILRKQKYVFIYLFIRLSRPAVLIHNRKEHHRKNDDISG